MNILTFSENSDYVGQSRTQIRLHRGDSYGRRRCTYITINEDDIVEYDEVFNVILTESSRKLTIQPGRSITQIMIREDNDCESIK